MRGRLLGALLALGLAASMTPAAAFAAENATSDSMRAENGAMNSMAKSFDPSTVATITDYSAGGSKVVEYTSLKDAVAVGDGKMIVLQQDCSEAVEVKRSISFAIDPNGHSFTGEVSVPEDFTLSKKTHGTIAPKIYFTIIAPISDGIEGEEGVDRVAGVETPQTSVKISQTAFPDGSDWAVVACATDFADAMSATGLAGTLDCPILTTDIHETSPEVLQEIERLGAENVYIIGGKAAIPADVEGDLSAMGVASERVYGPNAWDTSVACATKIAEHNGNPESNAIISTSVNFQDALSMSSYAYKYKVPIFLTTNKKALTVPAKSAIDGLTGTVYIAGGNSVVPSLIAEKAFGARVVRIAGSTGYDTSNQIATYMANAGLLGNEAVCVASGSMVSKGLDALSGAALAGRNNAPILLVNGELVKDDNIYEPVNTIVVRGDDSEGTEAFITHNAESIEKVYILGGSKVVPTGIQNTIDAIIG